MSRPQALRLDEPLAALGKEAIKEFEHAVAADAGFIGFGVIGQVANGSPASGMTVTADDAAPARKRRQYRCRSGTVSAAQDLSGAASLPLTGRDDCDPFAQGKCPLRIAWLVAEDVFTGAKARNRRTVPDHVWLRLPGSPKYEKMVER
jgi:hypothetical protein